MIFRSLLIVQVHPGQGEQALRAYAERKVLAECAAAVPEFLSGRVYQSVTDVDRMCIEVDWSDEKGWSLWAESPVRAAQMADLAHFIVAVVHSDLYLLDSD